MKCGAYQDKWKRRLQYIATIGTALSLLGGVFLFGLDRAAGWWRELHRKTDIHVIALDTSRGITAVNTGDGPVLLLALALEIEGVGATSIPINKRIEPGQMVQYDMPQVAKASILLAHISRAEWLKALAAARSFDRSGCISAVAFADIDPTYALYAEAGRRDRHHFPWLHAIAVLRYYDFRSGGGEVRIPAHAFLFRHSDCQPYSSELRPPDP